MSQSNLQPPATNSTALLVDYLLAENPVGVVCITDQGQPPILAWPESATRNTPLITVASLDQAEAAMTRSKDDNALAGTSCMALLDLDGAGIDVEAQLGRAVRLFPEHLIVYTCSVDLLDTAMFAFGFRKLDVKGLSSTDAPVRWFEYRLSHYKSSPDWLNARFWANPERFDVDDDPDIYCEPDDSDEEE